MRLDYSPYALDLASPQTVVLWSHWLTPKYRSECITSMCSWKSSFNLISFESNPLCMLWDRSAMRTRMQWVRMVLIQTKRPMKILPNVMAKGIYMMGVSKIWEMSPGKSGNVTPVAVNISTMPQNTRHPLASCLAVWVMERWWFLSCLSTACSLHINCAVYLTFSYLFWLWE